MSEALNVRKRLKLLEETEGGRSSITQSDFQVINYP